MAASGWLAGPSLVQWTGTTDDADHEGIKSGSRVVIEALFELVGEEGG